MRTNTAFTMTALLGKDRAEDLYDQVNWSMGSNDICSSGAGLNDVSSAFVGC